jgi:hypothetical protein
VNLFFSSQTRLDEARFFVSDTPEVATKPKHPELLHVMFRQLA